MPQLAARSASCCDLRVDLVEFYGAARLWRTPRAVDRRARRGHSQGGQDRIVSSVFEGQRGGYFVDLAAASPVVLSNSRTLERDFAWRGLCIEGNHRLIASLMRERKCSVVHTLISYFVIGAPWLRLAHALAQH